MVQNIFSITHITLSSLTAPIGNLLEAVIDKLPKHYLVCRPYVSKSKEKLVM